jgi:hypothetical protein
MKKAQITINAFALGLLALLFLASLVDGDLKVRMKVTELDRAGVINQEAFSKTYPGKHFSVRSPEFSQYLAESWIAHQRAALMVGALISAMNLALALGKRQAPANAG